MKEKKKHRKVSHVICSTVKTTTASKEIKLFLRARYGGIHLNPSTQRAGTGQFLYVPGWLGLHCEL